MMESNEIHGRRSGLRPMVGGALAALAALLAWLAAGASFAADPPARPLHETVRADEPRFGLPIRCTLGEDCFVQNYVDRDPGPGWRDYACGSLSYNGHHGTDFRVRSLAQMEQGVEVLAAAAGVVAATRDGEPDLSLRERGAENLRGRDAGNAVRIDHGGGWETQYSHMKQGSVRVRSGQRVEAGTALGLVGLSGRTEFPHVDFVIRRNRQPLDPFDAAPAGADLPPDTCPSAPTATSLWRADVADALRYRSTGVLISGFAGEAVDRGKAQRGGYAARVEADAPMLLFFVEAFGLRAGDRERLEFVGPDGRRIGFSERTVERHQALRFGYTGRASGGVRWPAGTYRARYLVERDGRAVAETSGELVIR